MASDVVSRIQALDAAILTPIALKTLGWTDGKLVDWSAEQLRLQGGGGGWGQSLVYRFSGFARHDDTRKPWSLILKVSSESIVGIGAVDRAENPGLQREASFYRSELIEEFPDGFRPARCYAVDEQTRKSGSREFWIWLEDLSSGTGSDAWTLETNYQAAYGLGLANGAFIDHHSFPHMAWLNRRNVREYLRNSESQFQTLFTDCSTPLIRQAFPVASVDSLMSMWQSRETHLQTLASVPQTLIHGDAQATNLFSIDNGSRGRDIVAVDWENAGVGPVGLDAVQAYAWSILDWSISADQLADVGEGFYKNYLNGIRASGWQGEDEVVRLGYTASMIRARALLVRRTIQIFLDEAVQKRVIPALAADGLTLEDLAERIASAGQCLSQFSKESYALRDRLL